MADTPPGWAPKSSLYLGFAIFFLVFCTLLVAMRFRSRFLKGTGYGWDDWFILAALPAFYGQMAVQLYALLGGGLGWHASQVSTMVVENLLMELTIIQFTYAFVFLFIRLSIAALFLRIFPQVWLQRTLYVCIAAAVMWSIFVLITALTVCIPFRANWDLTLTETHCNAEAKKASYVVNAVWSILYDTVIWIIPQFCVWGLQMQLPAKITLSCVFALGIFDIVVSVVRIVTINSLSFDDITYASWGGHFWSMVEVSVAMIVACAPMCKQAFEELLPAKFKSLFTKPSRHENTGVLTSRSEIYMELNDYQYNKTSEASASLKTASDEPGRVRVLNV